MRDTDNTDAVFRVRRWVVTPSDPVPCPFTNAQSPAAQERRQHRVDTQKCAGSANGPEFQNHGATSSNVLCVQRATRITHAAMLRATSYVSSRTNLLAASGLFRH